jgi:hypothetical protein
MKKKLKNDSYFLKLNLGIKLKQIGQVVFCRFL